MDRTTMQQCESRIKALQDENQQLHQRLNRVEQSVEQIMRRGDYSGFGGYNNHDNFGYMNSVRDREKKRIHMEQGRWDDNLRYSRYTHPADPIFDPEPVPLPVAGRRRLSIVNPNAMKSDPRAVAPRAPPTFGNNGYGRQGIQEEQEEDGGHKEKAGSSEGGNEGGYGRPQGGNNKNDPFADLKSGESGAFSRYK